MKITLVSGIYPPDIGGPATFIPQLAAELTAQGHDVQCVALRSEKHGTRKYSGWDEYFVIRENWLPIRFVKTIWKVFSVSRRTDVIFANGLHQEVAIANLFLRKRLVAKVVGDPVWERAVNNSKKPVEIEVFQTSPRNFSVKLQRLFLTWSLNQFTLIITPGNSLANVIRDWGVTTPVKFIPNGTPDANMSKIQDKSYDVIVVNRLVLWKNVDRLIEALSGTRLKLAIVGEGPEFHNLKNLAKKFKVDADFLGKAGTEEIDQLLSKSNVFALLSSYEGMSFSLLRAMMFGMPIMVSSIPANTDVISHLKNGVVVDASDMNEVRKSLRRLTEDSQLSAKLGSAAREKALSEYTLQKVLFETVGTLTIQGEVS